MEPNALLPSMHYLVHWAQLVNQVEKKSLSLAHVVNVITCDYGPQDISSIRSLPFLEGKPLADPEFAKSEHIDILLSIPDSNRCICDPSESTPDRSFRSCNSVFGWIVGGQTSAPEASSECMNITSMESRADEILQHFWAQEEVPGDERVLSSEDQQQALENFKNTTLCDPQGRFFV